VLDDLEQRLPEPPPVLGVPVDVVDVLVLLGRVLGVLERAVGAAVEPLRVLGQPRVVGAALDGEVQGDLDAVVARAVAQVAEVLLGAEVGVDRVVAAEVMVADRPRRAGVVRAGLERVVAALAVLDADRVDRGQVEDVEPELGEARQLGLDAVEAAPRAREQLVPGAEAGALAVDLELDGPLERGGVVAGGVRLGLLEELGVERGLDAVGVRGIDAVALHEQPALGELAREVGLAGGVLALDLGVPGAEGVGPRLDRPLPDAAGRDGEAAGPGVAVDVGVDAPQLVLGPLLRALGARLDDGAQEVGAVLEDLGGHLVGVAGDRLGAVAPAVDQRARVLDLDARGGLLSGRSGHWPVQCPTSGVL
jgi:hypothetical protein